MDKTGQLGLFHSRDNADALENLDKAVTENVSSLWPVLEIRRGRTL